MSLQSPEARRFTGSTSVSLLALSYSTVLTGKSFAPAVRASYRFVLQALPRTEKRPEDSHVSGTNPPSRSINNSKGQSVWYMREKGSLLSPPVSIFWQQSAKRGRNPRGLLHGKCSFMFCKVNTTSSLANSTSMKWRVRACWGGGLL